MAPTSQRFCKKKKQSWACFPSDSFIAQTPPRLLCILYLASGLDLHFFLLYTTSRISTKLQISKLSQQKPITSTLSHIHVANQVNQQYLLYTTTTTTTINDDDYDDDDNDDDDDDDDDDVNTTTNNNNNNNNNTVMYVVWLSWNRNTVNEYTILFPKIIDQHFSPIDFN